MSIADQFGSMVGKLIQDDKNGKKASFAFVALSSDTGNTDTENYVTDALTEAVFNAGKICAMSRATVQKDSYLADHAGVGTARASEAQSSGTSVGKASDKGITQSAWIVRKRRNDFDGCTV